MTPPRGGTRRRTARYPHRRGVTAGQRRQAHIDWLKLIEVSGPFLSVPVLTAEWPDLEALDARALERLRQEHRQWQEDPARNRAAWIAYVLGELLGWGEAIQRVGQEQLALEVPEHEATLTPSFTVADPGTGQAALLGLVSDGSPVARIAGSDWPATPADRLAMLCRHHGIELGLATDGRWWALIWAPAKGVTTTAVFDAIAWPEPAEQDVVRAFLSLLQRRRFFVVQEARRLPALLRESLNNQEEITDRLGVQVRQAVELLVAAFGRADAYARDRGQPGLAAVTAQEVYRGAVAVMMRIIFLLFAEESGLLPADSELYARAYSVGGLAAELEQRVTDARGNEGELEHTYLAWHRLLALFTAVYRGVDHPDLDLIAHDGSLFDPDAHPWLEGRQPGQDTPGTPLAVDDRTVLHMLRAVQTVTIGGELRTVSFRTLTVEQIGYAYEGLLSYEGFRAAEVVVGLTGKDGHEDEVPLAEMERLAAAYPGAEALAARLAEAHRESGIGSPRALAARLGPLTADEQAQAEARLYAVTRDHDLVRRLLPFYNVIRQDLRGDPVVILPGALYVTESTLRASSGTHYTPKFLAQEVAEGALEPLVYHPGPVQTADRSAWKLRKPGEILSLKVADIAMGSGAFLVAACRYLAGKLIEAWSAEGDPRTAHVVGPETDSLLDLDTTADPVVIEARRQVIEHCLYGVDINPMAVEMAKLSLWLVSMDPRRPFTFLDDRLACGDSLLGITSAEQLEWMHLDPREGRKLHEGTLLDFTAGVRRLLAEAATERLGLVDIADSDIQALNKKRQILASVHARTEQLARYADLIVGAALARAQQGNLWIGAAETASRAATQDAIEDAVTQAREWLATDQPAGGFDRQPLHWPLIFPEAFDPARPHGPGFDAIIGNPPFLGGQKLTGSLGTAYREYLVQTIGRGVRGSAEHAAREARPSVRRKLLAVGARSAEFAGWLYRDSAALRLAGYWHDRAVEWAQMAGETALQGYVLLKKSQAAWDERDAPRMLMLARAARHGPWVLPPWVQAEAIQQEARAEAMLGADITTIAASLDEARSLLTRAQPASGGDGSTLAAHYGTSLLAMQMAICYCEAGQPARAAEIYDEYLTADAFSRRDYGYFRALAGIAVASAGRPDDAAAIGRESLGIADATGSLRTLTELSRLAERLSAWPGRPAVQLFRAELAAGLSRIQ